MTERIIHGRAIVQNWLLITLFVYIIASFVSIVSIAAIMGNTSKRFQNRYDNMETENVKLRLQLDELLTISYSSWQTAHFRAFELVSFLSKKFKSNRKMGNVDEKQNQKM